MKYIYFPLFLLFTVFPTIFLHAEKDVIQVQCELKGCTGDLYLYTFNGFDFEEVASAAAEGEGVYEFKIPTSAPRFYYIGTQKDQAKPIILGSETGVKLRGTCSSIRSVQVMESPLNKKYTLLRGELAKLTRATNTHIKELSNAYRAKDEASAEVSIGELKKIDLEKTAFLDSVRQENSFLYTIAGLNTMLSYQNNPGNYTNEIEYFSNEFFHFIDLTSPDLEGNSMIYEAFRNYASTLSSVGLPPAAQLAFLKNNLSRVEKNVATYKLALGGVLNALERTSNTNYKPLAQDFIQKYEKTEPVISAQLKQKLVVMRGITVGGEAPDFSQATPEGEEMKLSELRGKVVLVDFWASWCGPCRRENPNVVRLYNQYKNKGFEILGVSLDKDKDRWLKAIEDDQLTWRHVSDLQGWSNSVAKMYGVRSIPHTVLLDGEGKVIARNLRGESLASKLQELFGNKVEGQGK